jgi:hypothetical protein
MTVYIERAMRMNRTEAQSGSATDAGDDLTAAERLKVLKYEKMHSGAWVIDLPSGVTCWVEQLDVRRTYLGWLAGLPNRDFAQCEIDDAKKLVRNIFHGPEPVVIAPTLFDAASDSPILPGLRFVAQLRSYHLLQPTHEGSWISLIWFAEIDDAKSVKAFVEEALTQIDWATSASEYSS